jgi:Na+/H+ antiporter NhaD/arsenite permease-like protein
MQILDGIGAGILGALFFIVIADLTKGTGRYNLAQGAASACWGLGAALSNSVAGYVVNLAGFSAAFLFLAVCALAALVLLLTACPKPPPSRLAQSASRDERRRLPIKPMSLRVHPYEPELTELKGRWRWSPGRRIWLVIVLGAAAGVLTAIFAGWLAVSQVRGRLIDLLPEAAAIAIFAITYLVIALGRLPGFRLDRAGAALVGASLMVAVGAFPLEDAPKAIDFDTIILLLGVMIVVANLQLSGFFRLVNAWVVTRARYPIVLLGAVILVSGVLSAFLVNDTICLALTPLVLDLVTQLRRNPVPYLLAIAMASNIGSTATITGNPQNMIIGSLSHIPYGVFASALSPIAGFGLVLTMALIALVYLSEFWAGQRLRGNALPAHASWPIMIKSVAVSLAMVGGFFAGLPPAEVAIAAGAVLLFTRRIKSEKVYAEIDWTLLLMFVGLFIVVAGLERSVLSPRVIGAVSNLQLQNIPVLSGITAVLSNIVSNVPAVLVLKPFIAEMPNQQKVWLTVAMASTLAGNFAILGSVANLIVVRRAQAQNVEIRFREYSRVGVPLTVLTMIVGILWLTLA